MTAGSKLGRSWTDSGARPRPGQWLRTAFVTTSAGLCLTAAVACAETMPASDVASGRAREVVSAIESANPPPSYRFSYTTLSPLLMACLSGVEDLDGEVDAERRVVRITSRQRAGDVYSLDGRVLIDRALLDDSSGGARYAGILIGPDTRQADLDAIERALGTSMSVQLAGGAWPIHPNELVMAMIAVAASITTIDSADDSPQAIRIVVDPSAYLEQFETDGPGLAGVAPIVDAHIGQDGSVRRLVVRRATPEDVDPELAGGDGFAMDFVFESTMSIAVPGPSEIVQLQPSDLPPRPTPIPCQLEQ